mmetsp:Transcript_39022/g.111358  ORF Transcript_39022/g.111358 Transcript_39022/m.111358 type:complete len:321 (+) Transcript_39022:1433-2395(+)
MGPEEALGPLILKLFERVFRPQQNGCSPLHADANLVATAQLIQGELSGSLANPAGVAEHEDSELQVGLCQLLRDCVDGLIRHASHHGGGLVHKPRADDVEYRGGLARSRRSVDHLHPVPQGQHRPALLLVDRHEVGTEGARLPEGAVGTSAGIQDGSLQVHIARGAPLKLPGAAVAIPVVAGKEVHLQACASRLEHRTLFQALPRARKASQGGLGPSALARHLALRDPVQLARELHDVVLELQLGGGRRRRGPRHGLARLRTGPTFRRGGRNENTVLPLARQGAAAGPAFEGGHGLRDHVLLHGLVVVVGALVGVPHLHE